MIYMFDSIQTTVTWAAGSILAGIVASQTFSVPGVDSSYAIVVNCVGAKPDGIHFDGYVSSTDNVTINGHNRLIIALNPGALNLKVIAYK